MVYFARCTQLGGKDVYLNMLEVAYFCESIHGSRIVFTNDGVHIDVKEAPAALLALAQHGSAGRGASQAA